MNSSFHSTKCALCGSTSKHDYQVIFPSNYDQKNVAELFSARRLPDGIHSQIVQCKKDGLVRSTPVLEDKVLNQLYKESDFTYQHEVKNLVTTYMAALNRVLGRVKKSDKILEIGCGSGFVLSALKKEGFHNVFGVEPSETAVQAAEPGLKSKIIVKPFSHTLFQKNSFNCIFFLQTLDHIPDPEQFLKECYELLVPGGFILSYHHNVNSWSALFLKEKSPIFDIEHTYLYSHKTTQLIFEKAGFNVNLVYSPKNTVSAFHLAWLSPVPRILKKIFLTNVVAEKVLQSFNFQIALGNSCVIAHKPL